MRTRVFFDIKDHLLEPQLKYRAIWIPSSIAFLALLITLSSQPLAVPIPGKLVEYTNPDKSINLLRPQNWKVTNRSAQAVSSELNFSPAQNVTYKINSDLSGSLMADIAKPIAPPVSDVPEGVDPQQAAAAFPAQKSALQTLHEMDTKSFARMYLEYQEIGTEPAQIAGTEALVTEFKCKAASTFSTRDISGKRISLITNDRRITIVATCPTVMKIVLFPVFDKMTESIQLNKGGS